MNVTWLVSRSSGVVAWALVVASCVWGLLVATRVLARNRIRRPSPAWIFSIHRFLGALAVVFTAIHVVAIVADPYVSFSVADVLVPFAASWQPLAVALGVVGMYLLAAIEITSLLRDRLSPRVWRSVHLSAYGLLALTTVHALAAGTDTKTLVSTAVSVTVGCAVVFGCALLWALRRDEPGLPKLPKITVAPPKPRPQQIGR